MYSYHKFKKNPIHCLIHISPLKIWRKRSLNEPGKQKLGRYYRSPVSRHSMQSYILTYAGLERGNL